MKHCGRRWLGALALACAPSLAAAAPLPEAEPNNSCDAAQATALVDKGKISGTLDAIGDIDFFTLSALPGSTVQLQILGEGSSGGTLPDPLLASMTACAIWWPPMTTRAWAGTRTGSTWCPRTG